MGRLLHVGYVTLPDDCLPPSPGADLTFVLAALEEQLAALDAMGLRIAAAHVSAAIEHLRLDLLDGQMSEGTRH
jgi:hypothetical protein